MSKLLSQLKSRHGRKAKRLGRGQGSGRGGTSTKGHKGQKARSGARIPRGFEGGQMPLMRRLPKFGFTNRRFKTFVDIVNLETLNRFDKEEIRIEDMVKEGLVHKNRQVKILGQGTLKKAVRVEAHQWSESAKKAIEKIGGQILPKKVTEKVSEKTSPKKAD